MSARTHWVMPIYAPKAYQPKKDIKRSTIAGAIAGTAASLITKNRQSLSIKKHMRKATPYVAAGAAIGNLVARYHNKRVESARAAPITLKLLQPGKF